MDSSRGFGSTRQYFAALFGLAFAPAPDLLALNLTHCRVTRRFIPQKARHQAPSRDRPLTACRCMVSGSLSFPSRGAFHLSLTVLVHYRSSRVCSLGGWSPQLPTGFLVSRGTRARTAGRRSASATGLSPSSAGRSRPFASPCVFSNCRRGGPPRGRCGCQPRSHNPWPVSRESRFGLLPVRSPQLGESRLMSFTPGTEMFQFPDWPPAIAGQVTRHDPGGVAPFGHRRLNAC
jgi:hypothetical protein